MKTCNDVCPSNLYVESSKLDLSSYYPVEVHIIENIFDNPFYDFKVAMNDGSCFAGSSVDYETAVSYIHAIINGECDE